MSRQLTHGFVGNTLDLNPYVHKEFADQRRTRRWTLRKVFTVDRIEAGESSRERSHTMDFTTSFRVHEASAKVAVMSSRHARV